MHYTRQEAQRLVCAIKEVLEASNAINAKENETLQTLETPQKWDKLPCGSRAQANKEYLIARAKKNEFAQASAKRQKDISVLAAEVSALYVAQITALQKEKECWDLLVSLYNSWEKEPSKAAGLAAFLAIMSDYLETETEQA